jgi:hypothetical protein
MRYYGKMLDFHDCCIGEGIPAPDSRPRTTDPFKTVTIRIYNYDYQVIHATSEEISKIMNKGKVTDNIYLGACCTSPQIIYLSKEMHRDKKIPVLIHEIMHAILEDMGYERKTYSTEDVCCLFEAHYAEIRNAVHQYQEAMSV